MNPSYVENIMNEMGWGDGNFLPIANTENQKLMDRITELQKTRIERETELKSIDERASKLESHYKNAECSIDQNAKLLSAQRSDINSETHMHKVCERETSKMNVDLKDLFKDIQQCEEFEKQTAKNIKLFMKNIETLTDKIKWAKTSLEEWRLAMDEGEEANKMIEKYCKNDEKKAAELDHRRRILVEDIYNKRQKLIDIIENQKTLEKSLDRTAELYRRAHAERRAMVDTWKEAIKVMNNREADIRAIEDDIDNALILKDDRQTQFEENEKFLKQLQENNKEVEAEISMHNTENSNLRAQYDEILKIIALRENEYQILKKQMQGIANHVQQQRNKNKQSLSKKEEKENEILRMADIIRNLHDRHKRFLNKHLSATDRLNMIEDMINNETKIKEQISSEINRINKLQFRSQERVASLKNEEKLLESENMGINAAITSIKRGLVDLKKNVLKATEDQYDMSMKIQILEIKITKVSGGTVDITETIRNEEKLEALEAEAAVTLKKNVTIQSQIEKLEADMKTMTILYTEDQKIVDKLQYKLKELTLYVEVGEKQIKEKTLENQEKIVEMSILKMRTHEMDTQIAKCQDKVLNLEKFRVEMEKAVSERLLQLKIETEVLQTKRRHLQEERSAYKMDLAERQLKIDATVKRYILSLDLLGKNEDGSLVTATQLKIERAQEKQMILVQGNELNAKVLKTEHEIKQMENTLCLLNFSNSKYKQNMEKTEDESTELKELQKQEENYCNFLQRLKGLKHEIDNLSRKIDENVETRETIERQLEEQMRIRAENSDILMKVHKELLEQKTKLQRADREIRYATRDIRQRSFTDIFLMHFEKDLILKEISQRNNCALQLYADLIDSNIEMTSDVLSLLDNKGLKLPQVQIVKPRSATSWRSNYSDITISCSSKAFSSLLSASSRLSGGSEDSDDPKLGVGTARPSVISIDFQPSEVSRDSNRSGRSSVKPPKTTSRPKNK